MYVNPQIIRPLSLNLNIHTLFILHPHPISLFHFCFTQFGMQTHAYYCIAAIETDYRYSIEPMFHPSRIYSICAILRLFTSLRCVSIESVVLCCVLMLNATRNRCTFNCNFRLFDNQPAHNDTNVAGTKWAGRSLAHTPSSVFGDLVITI